MFHSKNIYVIYVGYLYELIIFFVIYSLIVILRGWDQLQRPHSHLYFSSCPAWMKETKCSLILLKWVHNSFMALCLINQIQWIFKIWWTLSNQINHYLERKILIRRKICRKRISPKFLKRKQVAEMIKKILL